MSKNNCYEEELPKKTEFPVNLNLCNFESDDAIYSPYVLTSPRSLKACHLANIKPIELLHRSIEDIAADLNLDKFQINHIYLDYEQERLKKLEICKLIRKHILTSEILKRTDSIHSVSPAYYYNYENLDKSTRPSRDHTPDLLPRAGKILSPSSYSMPTTPQLEYNSLKRQKNDLTSSSLFNSNSVHSLSSNSPDSIGHSRSQPMGSKKYKYAKTKKPKKTFTFNMKTLKTDSKKIPDAGMRMRLNDRQLCWEIDKTKKDKNDLINRKIQANDKNLKKSKVKKVTTNAPTTQENNENSAASFAAKIRKKYSQESRYKVKAKKRNHDIQSDSKQGKKKEKVKNRKTDSDKVSSIVKRESSAGNEKFPVRKDHDTRILDAMVLKREKKESQDNLAGKANIIWGLGEEKSNKNNSNRINANKSLKPNTCACNENFALDTYFQQIKDRIKQLKENCLYKELHGEHVRQLARELQVGMEQWQDQVLLLQWRALQRAQTNAKLLLENKRLKTQNENKERTLMHALRFRNVRELERIKQHIMKKEIEEKDGRIEKLKVKREQEISNCRAQAHYTAELREQLRQTLTPETFDRKVTDVIIKSKFINRLLMSNPSIESKIRLG